ncbi:unnamed protein product [Spirodela intermedia]|uniref:Uncharacterized protein n=1 Tax=Spirodela intermedia TaxID=51605 RepID=A0A7I8J136_SPIIN|nr:unnamed protein product [Spirodela intermedia]CAA6663858.1 unnamed protein product [Spirodela intermedia]
MVVSETTTHVARAVERLSLQIERCIAGRRLLPGRLLHGHLIKTSLAVNTFLANRLVEMYAKCGQIAAAETAFAEIPSKNAYSWNTLLSSYCTASCLDCAKALLDEMPEPNIVSYNAVISGLTHEGRHREALEAFRKMQREGSSRLAVDKFTVVGVAGACSGAVDLRSLRQIHGVVVSVGLQLNLIMNNAMIDAYGKCGEASTAWVLFQRMETRDVFSWTSMVGAYVSAGRLEEAHQLFDRMPTRNAVSWSALITGYAQHGRGDAALKLFMAMLEGGFAPTAFALVSALSACTCAALVGEGGDHSENLFIQNALIDMYAKCGDMVCALRLFERMRKRDIVSWNSLVTGFAQNGDGDRSLALFREMISLGLKPNHVTFLSALSACNHAGLVAEARQLLALMGEHGVCPQQEHHAAMVDLLGRSRRLKEAAQLTIFAAPGDGKLDGVGSWGAILGACRVHGDLELARRAAETLFALDPSNAGRYVMLSNIYAAAGHWEEARKLRKLMKEKGFKKEPARSWIEVQSVRHDFVAEDTSHCRTEDIYRILTFLADHMKEPACCDELVGSRQQEATAVLQCR